MNICSYLVHIHPGEAYRSSVSEALNALPGCEATAPDTGEHLMVLVTETTDNAADLALKKEIETIPGIDGIALVFGAEDKEDITS